MAQYNVTRDCEKLIKTDMEDNNNNQAGLWQRFIDTRIIQTLAIYIPVGWLAMEIIASATDYFNLPDIVPKLTIILFFSGIPVTIFLAWVFQRTEEGTVAQVKSWRNSLVSITSITLLVGVSTFLYLNLREDERPEGGAMTEAVSVLAVLPFDSPIDSTLGGHFAKEILNRLARYPDLYVISPEASFSPVLASLMPVAKQKRLEAEHVVSGKISKSGSGFLLDIELKDNQNILWREEFLFGGDAASRTGLQRRVSLKISQILGSRYRASDYCEPSSNLEALEAYHLAVDKLDKKGTENINEAIRLFKKSIEIDPDYGQAYSDLAFAYLLQRNRKLAIDVAKQAVKKCPTLGWAYKITVPSYDGINNPHIDQELQWQDAIIMAPNDVRLLQNYAAHLETLGRNRSATQVKERVYRLNPLNPRVLVDKGWDAALNGNWQRALVLAERAKVAGDRSCNGPLLKSMVALEYQSERKVEAAVKNLPDYCVPGSFQTKTVSTLELYQARSNLEVRKEVLAKARLDIESNPNVVMGVGALLGDFDLAFDAIEVALAQGQYLHWPLFWSRLDQWPEMRSDPRFSELVDRLDYIDYWKEFGWPDGLCSPIGEKVVCK